MRISLPVLVLGALALTACPNPGDNPLDTGDVDTDVDTGDSGEVDTGPADADADGYTADVDCDDANALVHPGAVELCNGVDDDCDAVVDPDDSDDAATWYLDGDQDGHGDPDRGVQACAAPPAHVATADDCDDTASDVHPDATEDDCTDPVDYNCDGSVGYVDADADGVVACEDCDDDSDAVFPGATELCNGADDDCDGTTDEADADDAGTWYADTDTDGYGDPTTSVVQCQAPENHVADGTDCDDSDAALNPAAVWFLDFDQDGHGAGTSLVACMPPQGFVASDSDCDDADSDVFPGATELCDAGTDNDCDGEVDEDDAADALTWYVDSDADGFGSDTTTTRACAQPAGYAADDTDCDDAAASINPAAAELCDDIDSDCDGVAYTGIGVPADYPTIGAAVVAAGNGGTVCVSPGTYTENPVITQDVHLQSSAGSALTIIDGVGSRVVEVDGAAPTIEGFTLLGGAADVGAGLYLHECSDTVTLHDVVVRQNTSSNSGATCLGTGMYIDRCDVQADHLDIADNLALCARVQSAGIAVDGPSHVTLDHVRIVDNESQASAWSVGTGLSVVPRDPDASFLLRNGIVAGNTARASDAGAAMNGSAIGLNGARSARFENVTVHGNEADAGAGNANGAMSLQGAATTDIQLSNVDISGNTGEGNAVVVGIAALNGTGSQLAIEYSNVVGSGTLFSGVADPTGADGNTSVDPGYPGFSGSAAATWDLTLPSDSPLIDAGDPALSDPDGSRSDVGAYGGTGAGW